MKFDQYLQYRALSFKASVEGQSGNLTLMDLALEQEQNKENSQIKTVCAPISQTLFDRLDNTLNILDISKRKFIEMAIIAALDRADEIISEVDVFENLPENQPGFTTLSENESE